MLAVQSPNITSMIFTGLALFISSFFIITILSRFFPEDEQKKDSDNE